MFWISMFVPRNLSNIVAVGIVSGLFLVLPHTSNANGKKLAKPTPEQVAWQDAEMGMFIHFGLWSILDGKISYDMDVLGGVQRKFNPTKLDTDQWVSVAESMGAKYIVYTAKHADGFCMWQTDTTDFSIKNTPWRNGKGDIMTDLAESCKKCGMKLGVYLNPENRYTDIGQGGKCATPQAQEEYNKIYRQQLTELLTRYGNIFEVWFDGSLVVPVKDILEKYAPNAMVFQSPQSTIRWVGNEDGFASYPAWNCVDWNDPTVNTGYGTGRHGDPNGNKWLPLECDARIRNMWMYQPEDNPLKSVDYLMEMYYNSVGHGAVLLLNNTPDPTGLIPEADAKRSVDFGAEIKKRFGKSLAETSGKGSIVTLSLNKPTVIDHVITMEDITGGERVRQYVVEGWTDNRWKQIAGGISIGHKKIDRFKPVLVHDVRIRVTKFAARPLIRKLAVYRAGLEELVPVIKPPLSHNEVGHWRFDDVAGGRTDDLSELNNSAKVAGAVIVRGRNGNALSFDGSHDYVSLGDFKLFHTDFTFSARVNPRKCSVGLRFIMAKERNGVQENQCRLYLAGDNRLGFVLYDGNGQGIWPFETTQPLPYGQWSYIAVTRKGKQFALYVDGKEVAHKSSDIFISHDNDETLTIGANLSFASASHVFDGFIDDVKVYTRSLSDKEILAGK